MTAIPTSVAAIAFPVVPTIDTVAPMVHASVDAITRAVELCSASVVPIGLGTVRSSIESSVDLVASNVQAVFDSVEDSVAHPVQPRVNSVADISKNYVCRQ